MPEFSQVVTDYGLTAGVTNLTAVAGNGSANVKGSFTQLVASTSFPGNALKIRLAQNTNTADYLVDIAFGGAGNEVVKISNLLLSSLHITAAMEATIPLFIPSGTRISARVQASTGGLTANVAVQVMALGPGENFKNVPQFVTTYGDNPADSGGTSIDPGGTLNTLGAWVQLTAAAAALHKGLLISTGIQVNAAPAAARWLCEIGIGSAGNEVTKAKFFFEENGSTSSGGTHPMFHYIPIIIPKGQRIAVRSQSSGNDATDRLFDVVGYALS